MTCPSSLAMIGGIGGMEIAIILVVLLLIFGPSRLPKLAQGLGESVRHLRGIADGDEKGGRK